MKLFGQIEIGKLTIDNFLLGQELIVDNLDEFGVGKIIWIFGDGHRLKGRMMIGPT